MSSNEPVVTGATAKWPGNLPFRSINPQLACRGNSPRRSQMKAGARRRRA